MHNARAWRVLSRLLQVPRGLVWARLRLPHAGRGGRAGAGGKQALATSPRGDAGVARPGTRRHSPAPAHLGVRDADRLQLAPVAVPSRQVCGTGRGVSVRKAPLSPS